MDFKQIFYDYWKKLVIFLSICIVIASSFFLRVDKDVKNTQVQIKQIAIVIEGDVNQPGTYQIPTDISMQEAIDRFAKGVKTMDEPHVEIAVSNPDKQPFKPILINRATLTEIQNIPGVGPTKAKKIVDFRSVHGPFKSKENLMEVPGFGQATVEKMLPYIDFTVS